MTQPTIPTITNNAEVTSSKQTVTDENGKVVKYMYYLHIKTKDGSVTINTGEKMYKSIKDIIK